MFRKARTFFNDPPAVPPVSPPPPPPPPPAPKMFTQEEVNRIMAEQKQTLKATNEQLVTQLEELRTNVNLTQTQRDELDARIVALQQQHLTDAQKKEQEAAAAKKKYETEISTKDAEAKKWHGSYQKLVAVNAIKDAAATHKAANSKQLEMMLLNQVKVVEATDAEGKTTGEYIAKLTVTVIDPKTKQPTQIDLPVVEAVEVMKKDADYANLFVGDGKGGIGGSNGTPPLNQAGQPDFKNMTPNQYREWRAKQKG